MTYCENCGCKKYNGSCVNCHEEIYIEDQYLELDENIPDLIYKKANEHRNEIKNHERQ